MSTLYDRYHHLCFKGEETEAHRGCLTYLMSQLLSDRARIRVQEVGHGSAQMYVPSCAPEHLSP